MRDNDPAVTPSEEVLPDPAGDQPEARQSWNRYVADNQRALTRSLEDRDRAADRFNEDMERVRTRLEEDQA